MLGFVKRYWCVVHLSYGWKLNCTICNEKVVNSQCLSLFVVCLGLTSLLNIWGHIATVPTCSSGTLSNVLPHWMAMTQTQDMTRHRVTVYRHRADLLLFYPLMWNVTLEYWNVWDNVIDQWPSYNVCNTLWLVTCLLTMCETFNMIGCLPPYNVWDGVIGH